jgi:hypothetical protein
MNRGTADEVGANLLPPLLEAVHLPKCPAIVVSAGELVSCNSVKFAMPEVYIGETASLHVSLFSTLKSEIVYDELGFVITSDDSSSQRRSVVATNVRFEQTKPGLFVASISLPLQMASAGRYKLEELFLRVGNVSCKENLIV